MLDQKANTLTFSAVLSFPARVAYDFSTLSTGKVPKSIISGPAEDGAAITIVMLITEEAVRVTQLGPAARLHVLEPLLSNSEVTLSRDPADQTIWVVCKNKGVSFSQLDI